MRTVTRLGVAMGLIGAAATAAAQEDESWTPMLEEGTQELSVSGNLDLPDLDELDYDIDGSYGYFFRDGWEVGAKIDAADLGGQDRIGISGFTEYNFLRDSRLVPYIGGGIGLLTADFDEDISIGTPIDDDDGLVFDVEGGVKYFLQPYMAISAAINFKFATEDVFATDDEIADNLTNIHIGMRYYF